MKSEWRIFGLVAAFLFAACIVYAWWSRTYNVPHHVEWVGVVGLILAGLLCLMCGGYFWFVSRRIDLRPEDRADAEIAEGAGEVGFFSPGSYWPFGLALGATLAATGLAFFQIWLVFVAVIAILGAIGGLLF